MLKPSNVDWFVVLALLSVLVGCVPRQENEVVVYCSTDREYATPILNAFERIPKASKVASVFDVESSKTLSLATRIFQESDKPRCDVFWSGEILHTIRMQRAGLLERRNWRLPDDWPAGFAASDGSWVGLGARGRVLLVHQKKLPNRESWPTSVSELSDPKWKGRCALAKPLYGTTCTHMAVLASHGVSDSMPSEGFGDWIRSVQANAVTLSGNKQVAQAVAAGEVDWGLTDTDDAEIEIANGHPVAIAIPDQSAEQSGMLLIPGTIAVLRNAPHPIAAEALAGFLASSKTESRLTLGNAAQYGLWPDSEKSIAKQPEIKVRKVDFERAVDGWEDLYAELQKIFP